MVRVTGPDGTGAGPRSGAADRSGRRRAPLRRHLEVVVVRLVDAHGQPGRARSRVEPGGDAAVVVLLAPRRRTVCAGTVEGRPGGACSVSQPGRSVSDQELVRSAARRDPVRRQRGSSKSSRARPGRRTGMPGAAGGRRALLDRVDDRPAVHPLAPEPGTSRGPARGSAGVAAGPDAEQRPSTSCRRAPARGRRGRCSGSAGRCCGGSGSGWPGAARTGRAASGPRAIETRVAAFACRPRRSAGTTTRRCGRGAAPPGTARRCPTTSGTGPSSTSPVTGSIRQATCTPGEGAPAVPSSSQARSGSMPGRSIQTGSDHGPAGSLGW